MSTADDSTVSCEWCGAAFEMTHPKRRFCCRGHKKRAAYSSEKRSVRYSGDMACPAIRWVENERRRRYAASNAGHVVALRYRERVKSLPADHPMVQKHKARVNKGSHVKRARKSGSSGSFTTDDLIAQAGRQHHRCYWCKCRLGKQAHSDYHPDHVMPLALGGSNDAANIVASCPSCNIRKQDKHPIEWAEVLC